MQRLSKKIKRILDKISLKIKKGEHAVIIGPNGSGKSTLLKLITKDYYPIFDEKNEAYVKLFDKDSWDIFELRTKIGILSDKFNAIYDYKLTGREVVLSGFFGSIGIYKYQKITKEMTAKADEILKFLEIQNLANRKIEVLSSGEINRFLVGRALVNDPDVLIFDEPTTNLDIKSSFKFLSYIQKLTKKNKTIIIVTHNLHDIIPEIDRVILLKDGRIFLEGNKEQILNSKNISKLFEFKVEVDKKDKFYYAFLNQKNIL